VSGYGSGVLLAKTKTNSQQKIIKIFLIKIVIYLSLGLLKGRPSYRRRPSALKEKIQHFKT
jgi:hypothetical protein